MLNSKIKKSLVVFLVAAFLLQFLGLPAKAYAGWPKQEKNLPGIWSTEKIILVSVGTATVVLLLAYALRNKDKKVEKEKDKPENSQDEQEGEEVGSLDVKRAFPKFEPLTNPFAGKKNELTFMPILELRNPPSMARAGGFDLKNSAVMFGLALHLN